MRVGIPLPQGYFGEFAGWDRRQAWRRTAEVARAADRLGYDSAWLYDHVHTAPEPTDELTWESTTGLAVLAAQTDRIRLGQLVLYSGFRGAAHVRSMVATMDALSGGRVEVGMGAGWKEEEALAYGYPFPEAPARLAVLHQQLEVLRASLRPGIPIVVGGNGPRVTFRLAARYADELDLNLLTVEQVAAALPLVRARCEEIGREPSTLRVSVQLRGGLIGGPGEHRTQLLAAYRELGLARVIVAIQRECVATDEALESLAEDARASGAELLPALSQT